MQYETWGRLAISGIAAGGMYALLGLAFVAVYRISQVLNLAVGAIAVIAGLSWVALVDDGWSALVAGVVVLVVVGSAAPAFEFVGLRESFSARRGDHVRPILVTLGLAVALEGLALVAFGREIKRGPPWIAGQFHVGDVAVRHQQVVVLALAALGGLALHLTYTRTKVGHGMTAAGFNPAGAAIVGIEVDRVRRLAFVASCVIAAVAGIALVPLIAFDYQSGFIALGGGVLCAALAGLYSIPRTVAFGMLLGVAEPFVARYVSGAFEEVIVYLALVLVILARPQMLTPRA